MRPIDADALLKDLTKTKREVNCHLPEVEKLFKGLRDWIKDAPTVDTVLVKRVITALMDLRDAFVAKQPRSEWYKDKTAQGVEKGIEMCIARIREVAKDERI